MSDTYLILAGAGGILISLVHGSIGQRLILNRVTGLSPVLSRENSAVFQMSTLYWFICGAALLLAPYAFSEQQREAVAVISAVTYLIGALGNYWATHGRHYGWAMLAFVATLAILGA